jgi:hypothetical protein
MSAAPSAWTRFWLPAEPPLNLAAARVIVALHALWLLLSRDLPALSGLPAEFWLAVPQSARWRYLVFEGHPELERGLAWLAAAALAGAAAGVWPRTCCFVAGLTLYHLAPLETLILTPSPWLKGFTLSVPALVLLSLAPCGDALRPLRGGGASAAPSWEFGWALRLIQVLVGLVYLVGGYSKLFHAGWFWASAENMRAWLLLANLDAEQAVFTRPGLWIADDPVLCSLMGIAALGLDLGFCAALFSRRARLWLVPAAVAFHIAILFTLNYAFLNVPQLLLFVDWEGLRRRIAAGRALTPASAGV